jgi:hypothetical protein
MVPIMLALILTTAKLVGPHFGRLFRKHIWSPSSAPMHADNAQQPSACSADLRLLMQKILLHGWVRSTHRNLSTRRRMSSQKWTVSLVKQGKFKNRCSPSWKTRSFNTKNYFFVFFKWGSLAMSAGANPMKFWLIWSSSMYKCILLLILRFLWIRVSNN